MKKIFQYLLNLFVFFLIFSHVKIVNSASLPQLSGDGTKIVYTDWNENKERVYFVEFINEKWTEPVEIFSDCSYPSLNDDGTKVICVADDGVYFREKTSGQWQSQIKLSSNGSSNSTSITSDGTKIVYRGSDGGIYLLEYNGVFWNNPILIGYGNDPKISKNGSTITYYKYGGYNDDVYISEFIDGYWQSPLKITESSIYYRNPSINQDGTKIAFYGYHTSLLFVDKNDNNWQPPVTIASISCCDAYPSINTDGTKIAAQNLFVEYDKASGIWKSPVKIALTGGHPSINNDGKKIALVINNEIAFTEYKEDIWSTPIIVSKELISIPVIGSISPYQHLSNTTSALIWVEGITSVSSISKVWAIITPPDSDSTSDSIAFDLKNVGSGRYDGTYNNFSKPGTYQITVYAMDTNGKVSLPSETSISNSIYEMENINLIFYDDFKGSSINPDLWKIGRQNVQIENDFLKISVACLSCGGGGYVMSKDYDLFNYKKIRIEKSTLVYGSKETEFYINFKDNKQISVFYKRSGDQSSIPNPSFSITTYPRFAEEPFYRTISSGIWGTWFEEAIEYDGTTGILKYDYGNDGIYELSITWEPDLIFKNITGSAWNGTSDNVQQWDWIKCYGYTTSSPPISSLPENYKFIRMYPSLQQSWYFWLPYGIAFDKEGNCYIADTYNNRIMKFTSQGQFVKMWGKEGGDDGEFNQPYDIAADDSGNVYVSDLYNNRIQKFTSDGKFITKWGKLGNGNGQFHDPYGIAIDEHNNIYVADSENNRIEKFNSDGEFITKWGSWGHGDGQFSYPFDIAIDKNGYIYVGDEGFHRDGMIQKFTSDGVFITKWGPFGEGDGEFYYPKGLIINKNTNKLYVSDSNNNRIQKFNPDGKFVEQWASFGKENGLFHSPSGIALDSDENIYVSDLQNNRIQKFTKNGQFITKWDGFDGCYDITTDNKGNIYILSITNIANYIQEIDSNVKWSFNGGMYIPGITTDMNGNIYIACGYSVQKFDSDGNLIIQWDRQFDTARGAATDNSGNVYIIDGQSSPCIQKFTSDGKFIAKFDDVKLLEEKGPSLTDIEIDSAGNIYIADISNHCIKVLNPEGNLITKIGTYGTNPGQFNSPNYIAVTKDGQRIYVSDKNNNRIQIFQKTDLTKKSKAIILAGGGPYPGNNIWNATQMNANFAYRTLTYQGFTKETIYYLTSDTDLDLDNNGEPDDVDADATNANLQKAITEWAEDADSLVLYLVDHGGKTSFRMSETETLSVSDLDSWLDAIQQIIPDKVIVIYDACESGSFLSSLTPPEGKQRIVITSTSPDEEAYFITQGTVSFSNYFWTHIFNGLDIKNAFDLTREAVKYSSKLQNPLLDDNGDGKSDTEDGELAINTYIGNGTVIQGEAPKIEKASCSPAILDAENTAALYADGVKDDDGISRVWAVIRPPDYNQGASDNPVYELPLIELYERPPTIPDIPPVVTSPENHQYEGTYDKFNIEGTYQITVYARDRVGNTSIPKLTTVTIKNPLSRKAVIVVGDTDSQSDTLWIAMEKGAKLAYNSLKFQRYSDDNIYFMSPVTFIEGVDCSPGLSNLEYAINTWAADKTMDVVIYFIGKGNTETFQLSPTEFISSVQLDEWLDILQTHIKGKITVVYDACYAGNFLHLLAGEDRILIGSTKEDQPAYFLSNGDIPFSQYFWAGVFNGATVRNSFLKTRKAFRDLNEIQIPYIDDNGSGIGNEPEDGKVAMNYTIGFGIMLAGDDPIIGNIISLQTLNGEKSVLIWASGVTTTGTIDKVWAVINSPVNIYNPCITDLPTVELVYNPDSERYETTYDNFSAHGKYNIAIYAKDTEGNISMPKSTTIEQSQNSKPMADFTASITTGKEPLEVTFTDESVFYDGIVSWDWDFGDGKNSIEQNPIHTYTQNGNYTVKLTVTEHDGDVESKELTIKVNDTEPISDFSASSINGMEPFEVVFTDKSVFYDEIKSWNWDFGDEKSSTEQNPIHTYIQDGNYIVKLTVTENDGDVETKEMTITVNDTEPTANFSASVTTGNEPLEVTFTDKSLSYDGIKSWGWDFGDGKNSIEQNPEHTYIQNGNYTTKLTITEDDGDVESKELTITVNDTEPISDFSASPREGDEPFEVVFTDKSVSYDGIKSWNWDFGDGKNSIEQNPEHTYMKDGVYTVELTIIEPDNDVHISTQTDYIHVSHVVMKGDIDDNEIIELNDAILILKILAGIKENNTRLYSESDVNKDEKIGLEEVIYILQQLARMRLP